jgi:hypothetical protein
VKVSVSIPGTGSSFVVSSFASVGLSGSDIEPRGTGIAVRVTLRLMDLGSSSAVQRVSQ